MRHLLMMMSFVLYSSFALLRRSALPNSKEDYCGVNWRGDSFVYKHAMEHETLCTKTRQTSNRCFSILRIFLFLSLSIFIWLYCDSEMITRHETASCVFSCVSWKNARSLHFANIKKKLLPNWNDEERNFNEEKQWQTSTTSITTS